MDRRPLSTVSVFKQKILFNRFLVLLALNCISVIINGFSILSNETETGTHPFYDEDDDDFLDGDHGHVGELILTNQFKLHLSTINQNVILQFDGRCRNRDNFDVENCNGFFSGSFFAFPDKTSDSHDHDTDESKGDYDDESELGPTLDFGAKLDGTDAGNELPIFLVEPQSTYVVRNRAAILKCKAAHSLQVRYSLFVIDIDTDMHQIYYNYSV